MINREAPDAARPVSLEACAAEHRNQGEIPVILDETKTLPRRLPCNRTTMLILAGSALALAWLLAGESAIRSSNLFQPMDERTPPPRLAAVSDGGVLVITTRIGRHVARRYDGAGTLVDSWAGDGTVTAATARAAGDVFAIVAEVDAPRIVRYTLAGRPVGGWELEEVPTALAVTTDGRVAVAIPDSGLAVYSVEGEALDDWLIDEEIVDAAPSGDGGVWLLVRGPEQGGSSLIELDDSGEERRRIRVAGEARSLSVDRATPAGPVYIASRTVAGGRVYRVATDGTVETLVADEPVTLAAVGDTLYAIDGDWYAPQVRAYSTTGSVNREWRDAPAPASLALDASGRAYVAADTLGTRTVTRFDEQGAIEATWQLGGPARDLAARRGDVFVLTDDNGTPELRSFDIAGRTLLVASPSDASRSFAAHPAGGFLVVDDRGDSVRLDANGVTEGMWGLSGQPLAVTTSLGGVPFVLEWDASEGIVIRSYTDEGELVTESSVGQQGIDLTLASDGQLLVATDRSILTFDDTGTATNEWEIDGTVLAVSVGALGDPGRYVLVTAEDGLMLDRYDAEGARLRRTVLASSVPPPASATPDPSASPTPHATPDPMFAPATYLPWAGSTR